MYGKNMFGKNMYGMPDSPGSVIKKLIGENLFGELTAAGNTMANRPMNKPVINRYPVKGPDADKPAGDKAVMGKPAGKNGVNAAPPEIKIDLTNFDRSGKKVSSEPVITQKELQKAIIWSEILGQPVCKRGKRRMSMQLR